MKPFTVHEMEQGTPEWFAARAGKLTSSRAGDMMANPRKGATESVMKRNLRIQLALERVTGRAEIDTYQNADMRRGVELEPVARALYEARKGVFVNTVGFIESTVIPECGASLDGYLDDFEGIIEIKCPKPAIHLDYMRCGFLPADYKEQVWHSLTLTGAEWCDFISYCPAFPAPLDLWVCRYLASAFEQGAYVLACQMFLMEVDKEAESIRAMLRQYESVA